jgi:hypothetical protein
MKPRVTGENDTTRASASRIRSIISRSSRMNGSTVTRAGTCASAAATSE